MVIIMTTKAVGRDWMGLPGRLGYKEYPHT